MDRDLTAEEQENLDRQLANSPEAAARYNALLRQAELLNKAVPVPSAAHLSGLRNRARVPPFPALRLAASAAVFAVGLAVGYSLPSDRTTEVPDLMVFARQALAAHSLYVSEVLHPVEVAASEKDHLQSWLSNRLGTPIIAPQLGETGFSLIGGRLLPMGDLPSALFMYEDGQGNRLSLLATFGNDPQNQSFRFRENEGYLVVFWQDGPWQYSLVGDQKRKPMEHIARLAHGQMI